MKIIGGPASGKWTWRYGLWRIARLGLLVYGALLLLACTVADRMIHHPPEPASYDGSEPRFVKFGTTTGFYEEPRDANGPVLLWSHGNAEDAWQAMVAADLVTDSGCGTLVYDYPGYGLSTGKPTEEGCYRAAAAAYDFLVKEKGIAPERIIIVGQSVGSGAATWLAGEKDAAGLILISPFKSAFRVVTGVRILPVDQFNNLSRIRQVDEPLLVTHGDEDEVIPYAHGKAVYERAGERKTFVTIPGGHHNDLWSEHREEMVGAIGSFLERIRRAL